MSMVETVVPEADMHCRFAGIGEVVVAEEENQVVGRYIL
jgi:hypothetical protein